MTESYYPTTQVGLRGVLDRFKLEVSRSLNCNMVGKIESYDPAKNTASVSIASRRSYVNGTVLDFPLLKDCPVFIPQGGRAFLDTPISPGDHCIVLFSDRDIDNWFESGRAEIPGTLRSHSLSDGMVLVGIQPSTTPLAASGKFGLQGGTKKVYVANALADLKTQIDALIDQIKLITVTPGTLAGPSSTPLNFAAFDAIKTQIDLLLEAGP